MIDYQELKRLAEACIAEEQKCPDEVLTTDEAQAYMLLLGEYEEAADPAAVLALIAEVEALRDAALKVIETNLQHAKDQYGDSKKAESWSCVTVLRAAMQQETK